jgi:CrcB protein
MDAMKLWLAIGAGGALGAMARHGVGAASARLFGAGFPWGTLIVNAVGGLAMGLLIASLGARTAADPVWRGFLIVGVLGGFTTFSAFAFDALTLGRERSLVLAFGYIVASVALSIGGVAAGLAVGRGAP